MALGCSTAWNARRQASARDMIFEIKELGFDSVELSFNLSRDMVDEVGRLVKAGAIRVLSLHNYCPVPDGWHRHVALPDCYSMASLDEEERRLAVKNTCRTIDTAASLNAQAVVLHTGRVEIPDGTRQLIELARAGKNNTPEFFAARDCMVNLRSAHARPHVESALRSLNELNRHANARGVWLGVETRFYHREIPSFEEIDIILREFQGAQLFYWHDTGHAQLTQDLGLARHLDYLDRYGPAMKGLHLHNIVNCQDHQSLTAGEIDFAQLRPFITEAMLKIVEAHEQADAEGLVASKQLLEELFDGKL